MVAVNMRGTLRLISLLFCCAAAQAQDTEFKPDNQALLPFFPLKAPSPVGLLLKKGDRLAICGDSITEQRMYSRIMEDYLTMCAPQLSVTVRQYGWSGERAPGFLARMTNDCLRFNPTVATTCYGMNDHEYRPYEDRIGRNYAQYSWAILEAFKANGVRPIQGSPGCVGRIPHWVKTATGTVEDLNLNLCTLRNIGLKLAKEADVRFADVFWPMMTAGVAAQGTYGTNFAIAGKDGVHPGWAGQTVMAYAFLKAMGFGGDIATIQMDLKSGRARVSDGHEVVAASPGMVDVCSTRYPFCVCLPASQAAANYPVCSRDAAGDDSTIASALAYVPFYNELSRFMLVLRKAGGKQYRVVWGEQSRVFSGEALGKGINLAAEFPVNPFSEAFARVDAAVAAKQAFETRQVKEVFHGAEGKADMEGAVSRTERERDALVQTIAGRFTPVNHILKIEPL